MTGLYIGILTPGTTSRMRAEVLRELTPGWEWMWIDTDIPFRKSHRLWRSLAFRTVSGPAVSAINRHVIENFPSKAVSLAWIDKGVFLRQPTIERLRRTAGKLVHFTPDTAFHTNRSRYFEKTLNRYDLVITTKSFEIEHYHKFIQSERLHLTTQAYDARIHFPRSNIERKREAVFVGLCEPDRERCMTALVKHGIKLRLGGKGWSGFLRRYASQVAFEGENIFGHAYAELLSGSWVGLGLLSKRFPELHTTRTFEIPACGAVLATEKTPETSAFFFDEEAFFFEDYEDLARRIGCLLSSESQLQKFSLAGRQRVLTSGRDYSAVLQTILARLAFA